MNVYGNIAFALKLLKHSKSETEPLPQLEYAAYEILTNKLDIAIAAGEAWACVGPSKRY
jgi:hypothetical protein